MHLSRQTKEWSWPFWPVVPLYPYGQRRTLRKEVLQDWIWTFDQIQGILYVVVPIRMTVIRLEQGGLLVYAPIAPTPECVGLVQELEAKYGVVKYIILPTISGIEHKVFVGPFARRFTQAQIFVAPNQWSFPLNLPLSWLGYPPQRTQFLPADSEKTPFGDEFAYAILDVLNLGIGKFSEVAFFHKRSQTLLVTDSLVSIPENPPAIVQLDSYPLLFHAKDRATDKLEDNAENRRKGWQRICLFAFYFRPQALEIMAWGHTFRQSLQAADRSKKAYFGLFPFQWSPNWQKSFQTLRGEGRLLVAPILQKLILNRDPQRTLHWVDQVTSWDFIRIIPCHLDAPIEATSQKVREAFAFLQRPLLPPQDLEFLDSLDATLVQRKITPPPK